MELSAEQFIQIISSLKSDESDGGKDQRRSPRIGLCAKATMIPLAEKTQPTAQTIQVRDLSPAGVGFLHSEKMSLDEQFALILPRKGDSPSVVLCSVAFWQPMARELFAIGARFKRILRDGGGTPLPIQLDSTASALAAQIERLHRVAS